MGALSPFFLLAGLAIAVPVWLHLVQRNRTRRISFPALRYLERTEREHAREIRVRQLLLLVARVLALLLIVLAGARLFLTAGGSSHPPTAVVIILDNSLSSGRVVGEVRVLDRLVAIGERGLDEATEDDRFWVIRAGEPWTPALPGGADDARSALRGAEPSDAAGDLTTALARARRLLRTSPIPRREIHLLSDLQRTALPSDEDAPAGDLPVFVWWSEDEPEANRALVDVTLGQGLPPLEGERSTVTVTALGPSDDSDTAAVAVRLVVNERIRGAGSVPPGAQDSLPLPPSGSGWIRGYVDADPDDLRADDRRYFAFRSRPAPRVSVGGSPGRYLTEAVDVLTDAERVRRSPTTEARLLISQDGVALDARGDRTAALVLPPDEVTLLPALNRRLADAGIPWRYEPLTASGEADLRGDVLPPMLEGVTVRRRYGLSMDPEPATPPRTVAEVAGAPWAVEGLDADERPYLLLASPLSRDATNLPVSTAMVRFVDWAATEWAASGGGGAPAVAGSHLAAPSGAGTVRLPDGEEREIDGTRIVRGAGRAGFYTFLADDSTVAVVAVNPPAEESRLERAEPEALTARIGEGVRRVSDEDAWASTVYLDRRGSELWRPLLLAAVVLLLAESLMAASGGSGGRAAKRRPRRDDHVRGVTDAA